MNGDSMKNTLIFIGLVALSVLYLIEVDFSHITMWNGIAFVIIALTLVPLAFSILSKIIKHRKAKRLEQEERENSRDDG